MMNTPQIADGTLVLHTRALAAARTILEKSPDMAEYLTIEPVISSYNHRLRVRDSQFAGSGATFLLHSLLSLCATRSVDLSRAYVLDLDNRRAFLSMIEAYLNG